MPCYCSEIPRCRRDILTIQNMKHHLQQVDDRNHSVIIGRLSHTENILGISSSPDNLGAEQTGISESNNVFRTKISVLLSSCEQKIRQLETELSSMQSSDRSYHASKSRR